MDSTCIQYVATNTAAVDRTARDQRADHAASAARKVIALGGAESDQKAEPARQDRKIHADEHIRQRADASAGERAQRTERRIARPFPSRAGSRPVRRGGLLGSGADGRSSAAGPQPMPLPAGRLPSPPPAAGRFPFFLPEAGRFSFPLPFSNTPTHYHACTTKGRPENLRRPLSTFYINMLEKSSELFGFFKMYCKRRKGVV